MRKTEFKLKKKNEFEPFIVQFFGQLLQFIQ